MSRTLQKLFLLLILLCASVTGATRHVTGTLTAADGTPFKGTVRINNPDMTSSSGTLIPAGYKEVKITNGTLAIDLEDNETAQPIKTFYTIQYYPSKGSSVIQTKYWVVSSASTQDVSSIETSVKPFTPSYTVTIPQLSIAGVTKGCVLVATTSKWDTLCPDGDNRIIVSDSATSKGLKFAANTGGNGGGGTTYTFSLPLQELVPGTVSIQQASSVNSGYLSNTDFASFANHVASTSNPHNVTTTQIGAIATGGAYADLIAASKVGTGSSQVAAGNHNHNGVYEPIDTTILRQANLAGSGSALTAARSDHNHTGVYEPIDTTILRQSNLAGSGTALTAAHSDHNHTGVYEPVLGFTAENAANKGTASGYAPLDTNSQVPLVNLPTIPYSQTSGVQASLGFTPVANTRTVSTTAPLAGGGALSADLTVSLPQASSGQDGYLSSTDFASFANHVASTSNPHNVTAAQVGNSTAQWNANKINGTTLSGLSTGLLKNTTGTGVPTIAVSGTDYQGLLGNSTWGSTLYTTGTNTVAEDTSARWSTNRTKLYKWGTNLGKFRNNTLNAPLVILLVGDSRTANESWSAQFRNTLQSKYGNAGIGYVSFTGNPQTPAGVTKTCGGGGTEINQGTFSFGPALDMYGVNTGWTCALTGKGTDYVIHYVAGNGNGSFDYNIDGGSWITVNTNNATNVYRTVTIATGAAAATHTINLRVNSMGTSGQLWLNGIDVQINGSGGVRVHGLGSSGAMASHWVAPTASVWQSGITALGGHVAIISLGTNEHINSVAASTQATNLTTLVTRLKTALPNLDVVLSSPADDGWSTSTTISQYEQAQHNLAVSNGWGWIDQYPMIGPYATVQSQFFSDNSHFNTDGGGIVSQFTAQYLFGYAPSFSSTANSLAANGTNCPTGQYPLGVDASGNAESCTAAVQTSGTFTAGNVVTTNSSGALVDAGTTVGVPPYPTTNLIGRYKLWRTNLLACSDAFFTCTSNPASVNASNVTLTNASSVTDPFGGTTTQQMAVTTTGTNHSISFNVVWQSSSGAHNLSFYCNATGTTSQWAFLFHSTPGGSNAFDYWDCLNGVVGTTSTSGVVSSITSVGGGWYRASLTFLSGPNSGDLYTSTSNVWLGIASANGTYNGSLPAGTAMRFAGIQFSDSQLAPYESTGTTAAQFYVVRDLSGNGNDLTMTGSGSNKPVWLSDRMYFNGASRLESADTTLSKAVNAYVVIGDIGPQVFPRCYWIGSDLLQPSMDVCNSYGFNNTGSLQVATNPGTRFRGSLSPGTNVVVWTATESYDQVWINSIQSDIVPGAGNTPTGSLSNRNNFGKLQIGGETYNGNAIQFNGFLREVLLYSSSLNSSNISNIYNVAKLEVPGANWTGKRVIPYLGAYFYNYGFQQAPRSAITWWGDSIMEGVGTTPVQPYTYQNFIKAGTASVRKGAYQASSDMDYFANHSASSGTVTFFGCKYFLALYAAQAMNSGAYAPDYGYLRIENASDSRLNGIFTPTISGNNCTISVPGLPDGTYSTIRVHQLVNNNFGIQGDTAGGMIHRMPVMANYYNDTGANNAAVIWIGVNSMAGTVSSTGFLSPSEAFQDLMKAVAVAKLYGARQVYIMSMIRSNFGFSYCGTGATDTCKNQYNALLDAGQEKYGYVFIPIADNRVSADATNLATGSACGGGACSSDGTHPSSQGYQYAEAPYVAAVIEQWMNPDPPRTVSSNTTVLQTDTKILCNATSGTVTITTPIFPNNPIEVLNIGTANNCVITPSVFPASNGPTYTPLINGAASLNVTPGQIVRVKARVLDWSTANPQLFTY